MLLAAILATTLAVQPQSSPDADVTPAMQAELDAIAARRAKVKAEHDKKQAELDAQMAKQEAEEDASTQAQIDKEARERAIEIHKQPKAIQALINAEQIRIGMNKRQVILSWGQPTKKNITTMARAVHEQWIYGDTLVYFDNGRLTAIQDSE